MFFIYFSNLAFRPQNEAKLFFETFSCDVVFRRDLDHCASRRLGRSGKKIISDKIILYNKTN